MTQIRSDEMTTQLQSDFLYNEVAFAINRYAELLVCDPSTLTRWFLAFSFEPNVVADVALGTEFELNRRYRAAAQRYMSLRANMMIKELLGTPLLERCNVEHYVAGLPEQAEVNFVANPPTAQRFDGLYSLPSCRKVGLIMEDSVRIAATQNTNPGTWSYAIPDGVVLIVSRRCFRHAEKGTIPYAAICFNPAEEMTAMVDIGVHNNGSGPQSCGVLGRSRAVVQGYCAQFMIDMGGEIKTGSDRPE